MGELMDSKSWQRYAMIEIQEHVPFPRSRSMRLNEFNQRLILLKS